MLYYIIGVIVLLLSLFLVGYITKKKHTKEIERLETWKVTITDRPVLDEMSKVKQLNMMGQTEQLFERWRKEWDEIVTVHLPEVDQLFSDAEGCINKFQFNKANAIQEKMEQQLTKIEEMVTSILTELKELVSSEENNRIEIEELKDLFRELKTSLLANSHSFGKAAVQLELQVDETNKKFQLFHEETTNGNYLKAREIVNQIEEDLIGINEKMEIIPGVLIECQTTIPSQLAELKEGYKEMISQGYPLHHLEIEKQFELFKSELNNCLIYIEKTNVENVNKKVEELKESIELIFDLLEQEVVAKHYLIKNKQETDLVLEAAHEEYNKLKAETELVQQSYRLGEKELAQLDQTEKQLIQLYKRFEMLLIKISQQETAQTELSKELKEIKEKLDSVRNGQKQFAKRLRALRKDEISAREKVSELSKQIKELKRLISKSNLPGLPQDYQYLMEEAKKNIQVVIQKLEEKPLNMSAVQENLKAALLTVEKLSNSTDEMLDEVMLAERVIQYGNRYRSQYPSVAKALEHAETAFRLFDYRSALEQAATAVEEVEPGALKKIENIMSEEQD
ncbi:septation ring formation regulator EzrA [Bacillus aquiflavi]|uniref:Septation ring formation regulator EzrA n=1 Tax=Bacillus aquiflavi TaxID=2672567 RepID=A0A6B3W374_9BACI|nr:septation ring formation regulator EzrA [Bacillus aquiflavi]MBA4537687.1 septation ring formation regulator EzrA [Bacillus aquiflavi]NEY81944.1 septation ring formation regulator EzrA [Bacillus aquiflavi]